MGLIGRRARRARPRVEVDVDRLVLDGMTATNAALVGDQVTDELEALIASGGLPSAIRTPGAITLARSAFVKGGDAGPAHLGRAIGRATYAALERPAERPG